MPAASPATFEELEAVDWRDVTIQASRFALKLLRGKRPHLVEDFVQEGVAQMLDPGYAAWIPSRESALSHLRKVVFGLVQNHRRNEARWRQPVVVSRAEDEDDDRDAFDPLEAPGAIEEDAGSRELALLLFAKLAAVFQKDDIETTLLALFREGTTDRNDQVEATGLPDELVHTARRRIARHARRIVAELETSHVEA